MPCSKSPAEQLDCVHTCCQLTTEGAGEYSQGTETAVAQNKTMLKSDCCSEVRCNRLVDNATIPSCTRDTELFRSISHNVHDINQYPTPSVENSQVKRTISPNLKATEGESEVTSLFEACVNDCCGTINKSSTGQEDDGCHQNPSSTVDKSAQNLDVVSSSSQRFVVTQDDCCEGRGNPCCDEDCIERLSARQCSSRCTEINRNDHKLNSAPSSASYGRKTCCPSGIRARKFYVALLKRLGCLCRTVKSRGEPTCCTVSREGSLQSQTFARPSCGSKQIINNCCDKKLPTSSHDQDCNEPEPEPNTCHASMREHSKSNLNHDEDLFPPNLEGGVGMSDHIVLSVSGMTCVGCETKLQKSFARIKSVKNLKTSLILCRAEFDLDLRYESADGVIRRLQRMTDFKYDKVETIVFKIDICPSNSADFVCQNLPHGVSSMRLVNNKVVCLSYDPSIVGARELVEERFGCTIPLAPIKPDPSLAAGNKHVRHVGLLTLCSALLTLPVLVLTWAPIDDKPITIGSISFVLATLVQLLIAGPFYPTALKSLIFARTIEMELLIVLSTSAAYIFSVVSFGYQVAGHSLPTGEFFETSTLLVTLIMVGRWLSAMARQKAIESVSIRSLQASTAILINEDNNESRREIDTRILQYGDLFCVAPESRIPTDGTVISGHSEVDESMITGESSPAEKRPGSTVIAGSVNGSGVLTVRLVRLPGSNSINAIANMVDEAKLSKPRIQDTADTVAKYFIPTVIVLGVCTFIVWTLIGLKSERKNGSRAVIQALTYAITVIIVSCPCAIGLAIPMVVVIAGGVAAKHGCIFKTASTIEVARKASHIVFDKTGTLTQGKLTVSQVRYFGNESEIAAAVHATVGQVKHPVSVAVTRYLKDKIAVKTKASGIVSHTGKGIEGFVGKAVLKAGNSRWLQVHERPEVQHFLSRGHTTFCVTIDNKLSAIFGLEDRLRPDAIQTVDELQRRGIEVAIVSGDDEGSVAAIARQFKITNFQSHCTPESKLAFVKNLVDDGKVTIFCGDGTNDAAALAQSTIGVHINEGTDVAQSAADVILIHSSLTGILTLIDLSKASMLRISFNFAWSFIYNVIAILFASGALVHVRIPPAFAGLGELVSVIPVILIAVQLRWINLSQALT